MKMKFVFIHRHDVIFMTSKKLPNNCYEINLYGWGKGNKEIEVLDENIFYSIYCENCSGFLPKSKNCKNFYVTVKKMEKFRNYFNDKGKIESVCYEDKPHVNLLSNSDFFPCEFYKLYKGTEYDPNYLYIGTEEEKLEYFHRQYIDLKKKISEKEIEYKNNTIRFEEGEKELQEYRASIRFKGDIGEGQEAYDIIIGINSILSLNKGGWSIKYPKGKEEYENKSEKPAIIIGVLGNRNKGKSFILGKLSGYTVPQGFSIKTEGISVTFGDRDDHCVAILDSAGQEVPLLNNENNSRNELKENEIKDKNSIENEDNKIEINQIEGNDDNSLLEKSLRDKLITEKFIEQFIINTSDILVLVVGAITLNEQKILERIKKIVGDKKFLFIIHNLQNFQNKYQVDDYIENTLKKLYGVKIQENNFQNIDEKYHKKYYVEENNRKITHLIFINDYCNNADYYNKPTTEFLKQKLAVEQNRTKFSVIEKCKNFFIDIENDFLEENINREDFAKDDDKIIIKNKNISLRKVYIDEIGKTITNNSDIPIYNYYTEKNDLIINVELPGPNPEIFSKIIIDGEFYKFNFKGKQSSDNSDINEKHLISKNLKKQTPCEFCIRISMKDIHILPNEKSKLQFYYKSETNEKGIFTFKYHIADNSSSDDYE